MSKANNNPDETKVNEEGQAAATTTQDTTTQAAATPEAPKKMEPQPVEVFIPRSSNANDDPNMFVSVNGVNYLLPRGKKSLVPAEVAEEINRSIKAQEALDQRIDEMLAASQ